MEINIIDACKQKYGIKTPQAWPGTFITNLNQFKTACYGSCARFNNQQSISEVINSQCGKQCEQAMLEQVKLNGRNPCQNWQVPPMIRTPPRITFAAEYENTGRNLPIKQRGEIARQSASYKCNNDSECLEQVDLDYLAFKLAQNPPQYIKTGCSQMFPNIYDGNTQYCSQAPAFNKKHTPTPIYSQTPRKHTPTQIYSQTPRKYTPNIMNNVFPVKEHFRYPREYFKETYQRDCGCGQNASYWILGIGITFLVLFITCIVIFYIKKK